MHKLKTFVFYWLPPLVWMITIFLFSARPRFGITEQSVSDFFIFKLLHMIEYGGLYFLLFRAIHTANNNKHTSFKLAFIISFIYAVSDEIHQTFVPTREGRMRDVVIDTVGIIAVYLLMKNQWKMIKKFI
ncbi:MAG TPA: VanZ family protein [Candidatus Nitrosocosmicus sp.]|nr:VanZ family protein [Candidatus Nitrosocosmicus sp.]